MRSSIVVAVSALTLCLLVACTRDSGTPIQPLPPREFNPSIPWVQTSFPSAVRAFDLVARGSSIFAGSDTAVYRSTNSGTTWAVSSTGITNHSPWTMAVAPGTGKLYAGTFGGGVFISTNNGLTWTSSNTGLTDLFVNAFAFSGTQLFAGTVDGTFLSTNMGATWTAIGPSGREVRALATSGRNLFAGTIDGVFITKDSGASWTAVSAGLTWPSISALVAAGTGLFAASEGPSHGVYLSTNSGESWTPVTAGLTNPRVRTLMYTDPYLFAGTEDGVFVSSNNGTSWVSANTGMPGSLIVNSFVLSGTDIFVGTSNGGIWRHPY